MEDKFYPLPQPDEIPTRDREDAMGAYLMMFAAIGAGLPLPFINLIAAIVYYYLNKSKSRFVRFHSMQSVLSQLPVSLANGVAIVWFFTVFFADGLLLSPLLKGFLIATAVANIAYFVYSIVASIQARKGRFYYFIFFGSLCYSLVFKLKDEIPVEDSIINLPPKS